MNTKCIDKVFQDLSGRFTCNKLKNKVDMRNIHNCCYEKQIIQNTIPTLEQVPRFKMFHKNPVTYA